jgi:hypothetical protein
MTTAFFLDIKKARGAKIEPYTIIIMILEAIFHHFGLFKLLFTFVLFLIIRQSAEDFFLNHSTFNLFTCTYLPIKTHPTSLEPTTNMRSCHTWAGPRRGGGGSREWGREFYPPRTPLENFRRPRIVRV